MGHKNQCSVYRRITIPLLLYKVIPLDASNVIDPHHRIRRNYYPCILGCILLWRKCVAQWVPEKELLELVMALHHPELLLSEALFLAMEYKQKR